VHPPAFSSLGHVSSEPHSHHDQWLTLTQLLHPARLILVKLLHWRFGPLVEMRTSKLSDSELWPPVLWELIGLLLAAWCPASWDDFVTFDGGSFKTANEGWWQFVIQINPQKLTMHDTLLADSPKFIRFSSEGEGTDAGLNCIFLFQVVVCKVTVLLWLWIESHLPSVGQREPRSELTLSVAFLTDWASDCMLLSSPYRVTNPRPLKPA
jgi:hypothetical protein